MIRVGIHPVGILSFVKKSKNKQIFTSRVRNDRVRNDNKPIDTLNDDPQELDQIQAKMDEISDKRRGQSLRACRNKEIVTINTQ